MEFEKIIEVNEQDHYHFSLLFGKRNLMLVCLLAFFVIYLCASSLGLEFLWSLLICTVITVFAYFLSFISLKKKVSKLYALSRILRLPKQIKLNQSGFYSASEIGTTHFLWTDFNKVTETVHAFYLTVYQSASVIIPKRLLSTEESELVRAIIKKYTTVYELPILDNDEY